VNNHLNKSDDVKDLPEKILEGIRKAVRKLIETSAANNDSLVVSDKSGKVRKVAAKDLLDASKK